MSAFFVSDIDFVSYRPYIPDREHGKDAMDQDAEIAAMSAVAKALEPLEGDVRQRVINWAASRFGASLPASTKSPGVDRHAVPSVETARTEFDDFAELFEAATPKTDKDKALIAAYWEQVCQSQPSFQAQALNASLKHLGHGLSNVTVALEALKDEKPALILQLKKSGTSKQARKTYKLTAEGAKRVRQMLDHDHQEDK